MSELDLFIALNSAALIRLISGMRRSQARVTSQDSVLNLYIIPKTKAFVLTHRERMTNKQVRVLRGII